MLEPSWAAVKKPDAGTDGPVSYRAPAAHDFVGKDGHVGPRPHLAVSVRVVSEVRPPSQVADPSVAEPRLLCARRRPPQKQPWRRVAARPTPVVRQGLEQFVQAEVRVNEIEPD